MKISNIHVFTFPTVGIEAVSRFRGIMANVAIMNNLVQFSGSLQQDGVIHTRVQMLGHRVWGRSTLQDNAELFTRKLYQLTIITKK